MSEPLARQWQRFSPAQRLMRHAVFIAVVLAVVQSLRSIQVIPEFLYDAPEQMGDMLSRMWPIAWTHYPQAIHPALVETLHMATLGTLLSLLLAVPFGLLGAACVVPSRIAGFVSRLVLVSSRSVNSLVWALLFVAIFGPGPLAGMLAIAFRSVGFTGKLLAEALEQAPRGPIEALQAAGASWSAQLWYGYWPQVKPAFWSIVLLRWDINVRESGVLGLVGAGGIGVVLDTALNLFQWSRVAAVLVTVFAVVIIAEVAVTRIRKKLL
ncbi:MAG: phosphonate ABC transporter, permease protein PhnE [Burkholderiales bacterium]|nr:phosphonate ABC transporter, permease protein PhnE [Burkholderiales bacterium]